jgi:long-chain fatty acid transport protein
MLAALTRRSTGAVVLAFGTCSSAVAGGFGIGTQSASGVGNANAGAAAVAEDASTVFFNPAGMARLSGSQVLGGGNLLWPSFLFHDDGSTGSSAGGGDGGDGGGFKFVPDFYWVQALGARWRIGLGVNSPFGQETSYDEDWAGRYIAISSKIKTVNVNPSVSYQVSDTFSVGAGVNIQWMDVTLSSNTGVAAVGTQTMSADDQAVGFDVGVLLDLTATTRVGLAYRSGIDYALEGDVSGTGPLAAAVFDGPIHADLSVPESLSLSVFSAVSPRWDVMADVTWTRWSVLQDVTVVRDTNGATLTTLPLDWSDTWRYSLGANFRADSRWKLRGGVAYDETPTNDATRTPRVPDQDRVWLATGVQYAFTSSCAVDVGYAHEFARHASIDQANPPPSTGRLTGEFHDHADILSVQFSYSF